MMIILKQFYNIYLLPKKKFCSTQISLLYLNSMKFSHGKWTIV